PLDDSLPDRGRIPLPLGAALSANLRAALRARQLHLSGRADRDRRRRQAAGVVEWRDRRTDCGFRCVSADRLAALAPLTSQALGSQDPAAGAVDVDGQRAVPYLAERVRSGC